MEQICTDDGYISYDSKGQVLAHITPALTIMESVLAHLEATFIAFFGIFLFRLHSTPGRVYKRGPYAAHHFGCWTKPGRAGLVPFMTSAYLGGGTRSRLSLKERRHTAVLDFFGANSKLLHLSLACFSSGIQRHLTRTFIFLNALDVI